MELEILRQKLVAAARKNPPADRVPYGFETRVMAQVASVGAPDGWILWSRALWRAAIPCLLIVLFSGLWSSRSSKAGSADLFQQIESTVLSEVEASQNLASAW